MRTILFSVLCVLSFVSVARSALAFGERFGPDPPEQDELTPSTYSIQINEPPAQVILQLGPLRIRADGDNFIAITFGFHKEVLFPGTERPIQADDSVLIVLFGDHVDKGQIIEYISNAPNLGPEAMFNDPDLQKKDIFMFGFKIVYDGPVLNHTLPARKRRGVDSSRPAKRQAMARLAFNWYNGHSPLKNVNRTVEEKTVKLAATFHPITSTVFANIKDEWLKLEVSGGAVALVARNGTVDLQNVVRYVDPMYPNDNIIPMYQESPVEKVLKVYPGDLVLMFVPLAGNNHLSTLKFVPELVQDISGRWDSFIENFCKDQVAVAAFRIQDQ